MSISRPKYFKDLLEDCHLVVIDYPEKDRGILMAALILSDSLNSLRKALLQSRFAHVDKD